MNKFLLVLLIVHLDVATSKYVRPASWYSLTMEKNHPEKREKIFKAAKHNFLDDETKANFDFDELAHTLGQREIFKPVGENLEDGDGKPKFDLNNFFERVNQYADANTQSSTEEDSQISDDSDYYPWKKEDVQKLTKLGFHDWNAQPETPSSVITELFQKMNPLAKAFDLAESSKKEEKCPVGTIYTYAISRRLKKCFPLSIKKTVFKLLKYKLTSPMENPPEFPTETNVLTKAIAAPVLDHSPQLVVLNSLLSGLKSYDTKTPLKLTWPFLWLGNAQRNKILSLQYLAPGHAPNLTTYDGYAKFLDEYREKQKKKLFGIFPVKDFIHYPLVEDPGFEDITKEDRWQRDDVFVQQRLAGLNPMSLRKLASMDDPIFRYVDLSNASGFDWNGAIKDIAGDGFEEMVEKGMVFVLDYPLLQGIENIEDIQENVPGHRVLRKSISPFAVFVSVPGKNQYTGWNESTLKPLAIQMDLDKDAPVFTPKDGDKWMMAKEEVQRADITYVEVIEHLLKTHLLMEPICAIMHRSFSKLHPLYQLFHPHCKYLPVTNSVGVPALFDQNEFIHILFSIGNTGAINLLNKGYKEMSWDDTDFENNLKKRGVMDKETLPYFPYRDDGLLLWDKIGKFAEDYVKLYYKSRPEIDITVKFFVLKRDLVSAPASIITDIELQSFALQLSQAKIGRIAGGKFKGFPSAITTQEQLIDVVKRILFIPVQHSAINYPVSYYGAYVPNMPTKLYNPDTQEFSIDNLPYYDIAAYQLSIAMTLGSIRYDKIFDYSDDMEDEKARNLVKKYHDELHGVINKEIIKRNCKRQLEGKLIYPYFMPQWLTNSIQT